MYSSFARLYCRQFLFRTVNRTFLITFLVINLFTNCQAQPKAKTTTKSMEWINSIFDRMEVQGVATNRDLLYGYFFYDQDKSKLERLKNYLVNQSYRFAGIDKADNGEFMLHVEKVAHHTRQSLFNTEQQLRELAARYNVSSYDGFDVGNTNPSKPLISNEDFLQFISKKKGNDLFETGIKLYDFEIKDKAAIVFRACIRQNIKPDTSSYKLGNVLIDQNEIEEGIKQLEQAIKYNAKYVGAYFNIGATCYDNRQFQKSIYYYQQADKLKPNDDRIIYGIAASQYAVQQYDRSLDNCKRALQLNKYNEPAQQLLEMLKGKIQ